MRTQVFIITFLFVMFFFKYASISNVSDDVLSFSQPGFNEIQLCSFFSSWPETGAKLNRELEKELSATLSMMDKVVNVRVHLQDASFDYTSFSKRVSSAKVLIWHEEGCQLEEQKIIELVSGITGLEENNVDVLWYQKDVEPGFSSSVQKDIFKLRILVIFMIFLLCIGLAFLIIGLKRKIGIFTQKNQ